MTLVQIALLTFGVVCVVIVLLAVACFAGMRIAMDDPTYKDRTSHSEGWVPVAHPAFRERCNERANVSNVV